MTPLEQLRIFAAMMLCGAGIGAIYDALGILRRGGIATACADLLLGVFGAAAVITAALMLGCDAFRLYVGLGVAAGWALYAFSLGTIVRILTERIIRLSKKVAK